jgi:formiminotetrahydrofolate cyclodeaminase
LLKKDSYTKEQEKLIKLRKKIEKKVKKGVHVDEGLMALKTIYTMPQALEEVKQVGFEQMKRDTEELRRSPSPTRF